MTCLPSAEAPFSEGVAVFKGLDLRLTATAAAAATWFRQCWWHVGKLLFLIKQEAWVIPAEMRDLSGTEQRAGLQHRMKGGFYTLITALRSKIDCFAFQVFCLSMYMFALVTITAVSYII